MKNKGLIGLIAALALFAGLTLSATATAQTADETVYYCLNGMTVPPAAPVTGSSVNHGSNTEFFDAATLASILSINPSGVFYAGWSTVQDNWGWSATSAAEFEPGYSTNYVSVGACKAAAPWAPEPPRVAVCKELLRGDGTTGMFQEITVAQWNDSESVYFDAAAANWVEGLGLTCDNPLALGYKAAGYNVAWGGQPDPGNDPSGVRGSGFNNIYPYFTK
jgi:hypothetical protein